MAKRTRLAYSAAVLVPLAFLAAACSSSSSSGTSASGTSSAAAPAASYSPPAAPSTGTLTETGSSLMFPLVNEWQKGYTAQYPGIKVSTASTNSGTGITDAGQGLVNIGATDAFLSASQTAQYPQDENIPVGVDSLDVMYNLKGVSGTLNLNGTVLAQIYDGKITTWNDPAIAKLNPGVKLPATKIVTVHRGDSSGSTVMFVQYLNAQDPTDWASGQVSSTPTWPKVPGALAETGSGAMITGVASVNGAIGYDGDSYASKISAAKLSVAAVSNGAGKYVKSSPAALQAAVASFPAPPANGSELLINTKAPTGYGITGYEYYIVNTKQSSQTQADLLQNFLYWTITTGSTSKYLTPVNFIGLDPAATKVAEGLIAKISG